MGICYWSHLHIHKSYFLNTSKQGAEMLILTRKIGEAIVLDGGIKIIIADIQGNQVRIGVEAPEEVKVYREELLERIQAEVA